MVPEPTAAMVETHNARLRDEYVSCRLDDIGDALHPDDSLDALTAAIAAAPPEWLIRCALSEEEIHTLVCAMAGNHPESLAKHRVSLLRKLVKAHPTAGMTPRAARDHDAKSRALRDGEKP